MKKLMLIAAVFAALSSVSLGVIEVQDFSTAPALSSTAGDGVWYTDRYAPAVFEQATFDGDTRLKQGVRAVDNEANRAGTSYSSNFYNYQGRKFNTSDNPIGTSVSIDIYADSTWQAGTRAGFWTTMSNGNLSYPIIEFCVAADNSAYGGSSSFTGFRWWQSGIGWSDGLAMSGDDAWHNLEVKLGTTDVFFYVDGSLLGMASNNGADSIDNVILNVHNQGAAGEYDVYWDNFATGVPEPATLALLGLGGLLLRKRK